jgi:hypothetical protein
LGGTPSQDPQQKVDVFSSTQKPLLFSPYTSSPNKLQRIISHRNVLTPLLARTGSSDIGFPHTSSTYYMQYWR